MRFPQNTCRLKFVEDLYSFAAMIQPYLLIGDSVGKGRGVFTSEPIPANTVVELSPVVVMPQKDRELLDQTLLYNYIFEWGEAKDRCCMALGYIAMYNHASPSNCEYFMEYDNDTIYIMTMRDIQSGEELTINYNGEYTNTEPVWFEESA